MRIDLAEKLKAVAGLISERGPLELIELIWANDRYFTFPRFQTTARRISAKLREWGVRARTFELPADGKTLYGDWRMPLGWDCRSARLEIHEPFEERGQVLADYRERPTHVIMWSGPTPPEGITADLIRVADGKELEAKGEAVRDKIVYTPENPRPFKKKLAELGARAVVTSWCRNAQHIPQAAFWVNAWSDDPGGWAFHDGDAPLPGMVISPQKGVELDVLLDRGPVQLKITVDSEYLETTIPVTCGYIDAPMQEEVLAIGHIMEQGANDNASGAAVIMESLRVIKQGTESGQLAPLRRAVRGLLVNECYGTIGFAATNPGILRRITAALNWDTCGRYGEEVDAKFHVHRCPDANPSVADTLLHLLLETWLPGRLPYLNMKKDEPWGLTDNVYADPALGVPCAYVASNDRYWHTSMDTLEGLSPRCLHAFATISATYLHFLATASAPEALWLARQSVRRRGLRIEELGAQYAVQLGGLESEAEKAALLARAFDHLDYVKEIGEKEVMSAKKFMRREERAQGHRDLLKLQRHPRRLTALQKRRLTELAGCEAGALPPLEGLGEWAEQRPKRTFIGTPTYDSVPRPARNTIESPTWNSALHGALFWADGKRSFAEIVRRTNYEYPGREHGAMLVRHFQFMGEHGLIEWRTPEDPEQKSGA